MLRDPPLNVAHAQPMFQLLCSATHLSEKPVFKATLMRAVTIVAAILCEKHGKLLSLPELAASLFVSNLNPAAWLASLCRTSATSGSCHR